MHSCAGDDGSGLSSHSPAREQPSATSVPPEHLAIAIPLISCPSGGSRAAEARLTRHLERDRNAYGRASPAQMWRNSEPIAVSGRQASVGCNLSTT